MKITLKGISRPQVAKIAALAADMHLEGDVSIIISADDETESGLYMCALCNAPFTTQGSRLFHLNDTHGIK